jgi:hypothetical protein
MFWKSSELPRLKPSAIASKPIPSGAQSFRGVSAARTIFPSSTSAGSSSPVARDYRVEGTVFPVVPKFGVRNIEHGSVSNGRPVRVVWQKNEFGIGIDEFRDQPWTRNPIDLCLFTCDPFHAIASGRQ